MAVGWLRVRGGWGGLGVGGMGGGGGGRPTPLLKFVPFFQKSKNKNNEKLGKTK